MDIQIKLFLDWLGMVALGGIITGIVAGIGYRVGRKIEEKTKD